MLLVTKVPVDEVPKTATLRAGVVAVIGIFGLAWLGDSFIADNQEVIVPAISAMTAKAPWTFVFGLFFASVLLYSQAATARALMPLGLPSVSTPVPDRGVPGRERLLLHPDLRLADRGHQLRPVRTTKIGKYIINHSFMIPGLVATSVSVFTGLLIAKLMF
jgi:anaerobic C4-dicarboxylate transporter DcuA